MSSTRQEGRTKQQRRAISPEIRELLHMLASLEAQVLSGPVRSPPQAG